LRKEFKPLIIALFVSILATAGLVGAYYAMKSQPVPVQSTAEAYFVITTNATTVTANQDRVLITATASDGAGSAGLTVTFLQNNTSIGNSLANGIGVASFITPVITNIGLQLYNATASHP
jgi:hypothetical protein